MRNRSSMDSRVPVIAFAFLFFLGSFPGSILSAVVTLKSIKLYATSHTWTAKHPKVFFQCTGEKKIFLPDVVKAGVLHSFNGEESWQPVTELHSKKCKKCGIYEDLIAPDHVFDEWELCSSNFTAIDHHYTVFKEDEVIATFTCKECSSLTGVTADPPPNKKASKSDERKSHSVILQTTIIVVVALLVIGVPTALYKWWQKKKRQQQQARFMRLFDEDDDLDDELGLKDMY